MFTASDLADWLDKKIQEHQGLQDDWLIDSQRLGDAHAVVVAGAWFNDRIAKLPQNAPMFVAGGLIDVLRLGSDIDTSSAWGIGKGAVVNVVRLMVVVGPAARGIQAGGQGARRLAGLLATSEVPTLSGHGIGPCRFVNLMNVVSAVRGKTARLFASVHDVAVVRASEPPGARGFIGALLEHPAVAQQIKQHSVVWTNLGNLRSMDEAVAAAKQYEGAVSIGVQWTNKAGKVVAHRLALVKDHLGRIRILDYAKEKGFTGFGSLGDIVKARPHFAGIENAVLRPEVVLFQSKYVKFLQDVGDTWHLAVPVAVGFAWGRDKRFDESVLEIALSIWQYIKARVGANSPPRPVPEAAPPRAGPRPPAQGRPPEALNAPRPDWLPGVRYRLKYLAYYDGPVQGLPFDRKTKEAVIHFQTDQRIMIDGIPGPQTQGELVKVCGF